MDTIRSREELVIQRLTNFYGNENNFNRIKPILSSESHISLRLLDWLVTNYAKKHNISYLTKSGNDVNIYLRYKSNLRAYNKKMFDPFCRWKKIKFMGIHTTVGQLNFFHWAIEDEILDYLEANYEAVQKDMDECSTTIHQKDGERKKRHELSRSATKSVQLCDIRVPVKFD